MVLPNPLSKGDTFSETSGRCELSVRLTQACKWCHNNRCNLISLFGSHCFLVFKVCGSEISDLANTTVITVAGWSINAKISEGKNRIPRERRWVVSDSWGREWWGTVSNGFGLLPWVMKIFWTQTVTTATELCEYNFSIIDLYTLGNGFYGPWIIVQ